MMTPTLKTPRERHDLGLNVFSFFCRRSLVNDWIEVSGHNEPLRGCQFFSHKLAFCHYRTESSPIFFDLEFDVPLRKIFCDFRMVDLEFVTGLPHCTK